MSAAGRIIPVLLLASVLTVVPSASAQPPAPATAAQAAPGAESMPSFGSLFTDLPADARRLPTLANGLWLGGAGALALATHPADRTLTEKAAASPALDTFFSPGVVLGGGWVQVGGAFGTYLAGRLSHRASIAVVGADLVRAQIVDAVLTQAVKVAVNRERPDGTPYSFPSGHSSSSFATATVLARHFGWQAGLPAYAVATYVAASRLQENKHYLSDVIVGAGFGIIAGRAVTIGRGTHTFALSPMALRGGIGVSFTRIGAQ